MTCVDPIQPPDLEPIIRQHRPRALMLMHLDFGVEHERLCAAAREVGTRVVMARHAQPRTLEDAMIEWAVKAVDVIVANEDEAKFLTGTNTAESALEALAALAPVAAITLGECGSVGRRGEQTSRCRALRVQSHEIACHSALSLLPKVTQQVA